MSKTKEELKALKEEIEAVNKKLAELSEEELKTVTGGDDVALRTCLICGKVFPDVSQCAYHMNQCVASRYSNNDQ